MVKNVLVVMSDFAISGADSNARQLKEGSSSSKQ